MASLVSVIVPIYNGEQFLSKILHSIMMQSYTNLEVILINDGSTDSTESICRNYARKDSRIKVIQSSVNFGVSNARNKGLDMATGEYIYFADADDVISRNAIKMLMDFMPDYDMAFATHIKDNCHWCRPAGFYNFGNKPSIWKQEEALANLFDDTAMKNRKNGFFYIGHCFNKIFKRQLIEQEKLRFDEHIFYNEDRLFVAQYLMLCKNVIFMPVITYKYMNNLMSATRKIRFFHQDYFELLKTEFCSFDQMTVMLEGKYSGPACIYTAFKRAIRFYITNINADNEKKLWMREKIDQYGKLMINHKNSYQWQFVLLARICMIGSNVRHR